MKVYLVTSTTYGTWLPGDERGSVSDHYSPNGIRFRNNQPRTEYDGPRPDSEDASRSGMKQAAVWLTLEQAVHVVSQLDETCRHRGWTLHAASAAKNPFHAVVEVIGDPTPKKVRNDLKAWLSVRLNREFGEREWWTEGGSVRKKADELAVLEAVRYVRDQPDAWVIQLNPQSLWVRKLEVLDLERPKG